MMAAGGVGYVSTDSDAIDVLIINSQSESRIAVEIASCLTEGGLNTQVENDYGVGKLRFSIGEQLNKSVTVLTIKANLSRDDEARLKVDQALAAKILIDKSLSVIPVDIFGQTVHDAPTSMLALRSLVYNPHNKSRFIEGINKVMSGDKATNRKRTIEKRLIAEKHKLMREQQEKDTASHARELEDDRTFQTDLQNRQRQLAPGYNADHVGDITQQVAAIRLRGPLEEDNTAPLFSDGMRPDFRAPRMESSAEESSSTSYNFISSPAAVLLVVAEQCTENSGDTAQESIPDTVTL